MTDKFFQGTYKTNTKYPRYTIVVDGNSANKILYIAVQDVPATTPLTNSTYWIKYDVENGAITPEDVLDMIKEITGDLDDLTTEDKDNLVSAINELDAEHEALSETVSDIVDGTIPVGVQSDWEQDDTESKDFIKNKPFDVAEYLAIKENIECENVFDNFFGYSEGEMPIDDLWITANDVGKTLSVFLDGVEYQGVVFENDDIYTVLINMDSEEEPSAYPCFKVYSTIMDDMAYNQIRFYVDPDGEIPQSKIVSSFGFKSVSKLSGDKIQIDGTSIVSDDGVLKATVDVPIATTEVAGKVKPDGTTIVVNGQGTISATAPPQEQVDWDEDDPDSVAYIQNKPTIPAETPIATTQIAGKVKPDGNTISVESDGTIKANTVYSNSEKRIGVWIDGKPLYRIVSNSPISKNPQDIDLCKANAGWVTQDDWVELTDGDFYVRSEYGASRSRWLYLLRPLSTQVGSTLTITFVGNQGQTSAVWLGSTPNGTDVHTETFYHTANQQTKVYNIDLSDYAEYPYVYLRLNLESQENWDTGKRIMHITQIDLQEVSDIDTIVKANEIYDGDLYINEYTKLSDS